MDLIKQPFIQALHDHGGEVYMVGGNVRDRFLNLPIKDHDILIRKIPFHELKKILSSFGYVNTVGISFGIIKFRAKTQPEFEYDLSLPRLEKSTGVGHRDFEIDFDPNLPLEADLKRRDFTINAMALNIFNNEVIDPFKGQSDLEKKFLRQVSADSFLEDPLRMLRGVQFSARFNLSVEDETLAAMKKHSPLIKTISPERIIGEIYKLMTAEQPSKGFNLMRETGLLFPIFPFMEKMIGLLQPMKRNQDVYDHTMTVLDAARSATEVEKPGNMDLMFSALFHDIGKPQTAWHDPAKGHITFYGHQNVSRGMARRWMKDYRITTIGVNPEKVLNLVHHHMFETKFFYTDKAIRRFINKVGVDNIFDLIDLRIADKKGGKFPDKVHGILKLREKIRDELAKKPPFGPKDLALNGHDIMNLGFQAGPLIGKIQKFLIEKVLDEPELNSKEILSKLVLENFKHE